MRARTTPSFSHSDSSCVSLLRRELGSAPTPTGSRLIPWSPAPLRLVSTLPTWSSAIVRHYLKNSQWQNRSRIDSLMGLGRSARCARSWGLSKVYTIKCPTPRLPLNPIFWPAIIIRPAPHAPPPPPSCVRIGWNGWTRRRRHVGRRGGISLRPSSLTKRPRFSGEGGGINATTSGPAGGG